jgi:serine/threonine protein kinase
LTQFSGGVPCQSKWSFHVPTALAWVIGVVSWTTGVGVGVGPSLDEVPLLHPARAERESAKATETALFIMQRLDCSARTDLQTMRSRAFAPGLIATKRRRDEASSSRSDPLDSLSSGVMAAFPASNEELPSGTQVEGYTVVRALGAGQMGEVYEATAPRGNQVALKLLRPATARDMDLQRRFVREAKVCAELQSPHIVPVIAHGIHEGRPFLVMPLLRGHDLQSWLERTGPLPPEVAVSILLETCDALAIAHARGIVHRDLKPANIFLDDGGDGRLMAIVCDFGVAKIIDEDGALTASGAALGTPLYMAPEQLMDSKRVDARCDVWALGMTLYHMLAGRPAHTEHTTVADLVFALRNNEIPPLQRFAPWVSPSLARAVHAALLPRDNRLPRVEELAAALRRAGPAPVALHVSVMKGATAELRASVASVAPLPTDYRELTATNVATVVDAPSPQEPNEPLDALLGKTLGKKYRLVKRLGTGGMGAVYEAIDPEGTRTAVKVMHAESGARAAEASRRFTREMRAVRAVESPHVVKPIDFGVDDELGIPFFVMELLSGRDLASFLAAHGSLAPECAAALFVQACDALRAAHALGIIHRDIKPSNLFLHEPGDGTVVLKVCDFGIAKRLESEVVEASTEITRTGGLLGSPLYMSPEHAKNAKNVDARSDVWSLGLSLHEALSGDRPWRGCTSVGEVIVAICTQPVAPLASIAPWIDPALSAVVERTLVQDAAARCSSIDEFAKALRPFGLARPVVLADLKNAAGAGERIGSRATAVSTPGLVTSGSLRGAAGPAHDASAVVPREKRGSWKWIAGAAAAVAVVGGGAVAVSGLTKVRAQDTPTPGTSLPSSSATAVAPPIVSASATTVATASAPSARPPDGPVATATGTTTASVGRVRPPGGRLATPTDSGRGTSFSGAPSGGPAVTATGAASEKPPVRTDGRTNSRKDDG